MNVATLSAAKKVHISSGEYSVYFELIGRDPKDPETTLVRLTLVPASRAVKPEVIRADDELDLSKGLFLEATPL